MTELNSKQLEAYNAVKAGDNILLTGSAGTGKSYTIKHILQMLNDNNKKYAITATTGCAAVLIGGQTLHSYIGIGLGNGTIYDMIKRLKKYNNTLKKIQECEVLIIDEISMLDSDLFDKISEIIAIIKANYHKDPKLKEIPFGGIQLIFVGDFCQLAPVKGYYCFLSNIWKKMNIRVILLEELIRQQDDILFQKILKIVRKGKCTPNIIKVLESLKNTTFADGIKPTKLYPINIDVDKINYEEEQKLKSKGNATVLYKATSNIDNIKIPSEYNVELTLESQVMITRNINIDCGLVNGKRGVIVHLESDTVYIKDIHGKIYRIEYYKDYSENMKLYISHMPIKTCYALSIHKSQGMTIDALELDLGMNIFTAGQAYTALSRAKSLSSIKIIDVDKGSFTINPFVKKFYDSI